MHKILIHEGKLAAEVIYNEYDDGSPYSPLVVKEDVLKIDRVRQALRKGDVDAAARESKVFQLMHLAGE